MARARALVSVPYASLADPAADLSTEIEAAFGPEGLGIIVVDGVPAYAAARAALLPLASRLAALPAPALAAMEDPASHWNFGWSHGQERLEGDRPGGARERTLRLLLGVRCARLTRRRHRAYRCRHLQGLLLRQPAAGRAHGRRRARRTVRTCADTLGRCAFSRRARLTATCGPAQLPALLPAQHLALRGAA